MTSANPAACPFAKSHQACKLQCTKRTSLVAYGMSLKCHPC